LAIAFTPVSKPKSAVKVNALDRARPARRHAALVRINRPDVSLRARLVVGARSLEMPPEALGAFLQFPIQIGRDIFQSNGRHCGTVTVPFQFSPQRAESGCFSMTNWFEARFAYPLARRYPSRLYLLCR